MIYLYYISLFYTIFYYQSNNLLFKPSLYPVLVAKKVRCPSQARLYIFILINEYKQRQLTMTSNPPAKIDDIPLQTSQDDTYNQETIDQEDLYDPIATLRLNKPPRWSAPMYLALIDRVLASHPISDILPVLCEILADPEMAQLLGWNLMPVLLGYPGTEEALQIVARLGSPKEIILGVNEAMMALHLESSDQEGVETPETDRFCLLLKLFAIILPRIKTKYPSRFLATTIIQINDCYLPTPRATSAVLAFMRALSGQKRPALPMRKSSRDTSVPEALSMSGPVVPDPQAENEDPAEAAIQQRLMQGLATHVLEQYVNANELEWAGRLLEVYAPARVVVGRVNLAQRFREDPDCIAKDSMMGELAVGHEGDLCYTPTNAQQTLCRDIGLNSHELLLASINTDISDDVDLDPSDNLPNSPNDIPLSQSGCLFLLTNLIFSSEVFGSKTTLPSIYLFPDHHQLSIRLAATQGTAGSGVIDALLALGIWLEHRDKFVSGPLQDYDYLEHLNLLASFSATNPSSTIRYAAHELTSSILHAHPDDRVRLSFISSLIQPERLPISLQGLSVSAITWLREEIVTAQTRGTKNVFATHIALTATLATLQLPEELGDEDTIDVATFMQRYSFDMSVLNLLIFFKGEVYKHLMPDYLHEAIAEQYVESLSRVQSRIMAMIDTGALKDGNGVDVQQLRLDLEVMSLRIESAS